MKITMKKLIFSKLETFSLQSSQPAFTCSNSTIETLEQGVKYVQNSSQTYIFPRDICSKKERRFSIFCKFIHFHIIFDFYQKSDHTPN